MPRPKQKIKLSENLKMGVAGPASQGTFFKVGGVIFMVLSLVLAVNIFTTVKNGTGTRIEPEVLGAFDEKPVVQTSYTVQKGDTLFNIAQSKNISWQTIATLNNLKAPYNLRVGTVLKLPTGN